MHDFRLVANVDFGKSVSVVVVDLKLCFGKSGIRLDIVHVLFAVFDQTGNSSV